MQISFQVYTALVRLSKFILWKLFFSHILQIWHGSSHRNISRGINFVSILNFAGLKFCLAFRAVLYFNGYEMSWYNSFLLFSCMLLLKSQLDRSSSQNTKITRQFSVTLIIYLYGSHKCRTYKVIYHPHARLRPCWVYLGT
jgi:hypothetical protein